jgi:anti-sigma regulatory factor (Ser/Thr protein kinase)
MDNGATQVRLEVPASPEFAGVARLTAAGVAGRLGATYDDAEDLRVIVTEMCRLLVGEAGRDGVLALTYTLQNGAVVIEGLAECEGPAPEPDELSVSLLEALTDESEIDAAGGESRVRVMKRIQPTTTS